MNHMDKIVTDLQRWWNEHAYDVISDVGTMTGEEVQDYVGDSCFDSMPSFALLSQEGQDLALRRAFPNRRYGI